MPPVPISIDPAVLLHGELPDFVAGEKDERCQKNFRQISFFLLTKEEEFGNVTKLSRNRRGLEAGVDGRKSS